MNLIADTKSELHLPPLAWWLPGHSNGIFEMKLQSAEALLIEAQPAIMKAITKYDSHAAHLREHFPEED